MAEAESNAGSKGTLSLPMKAAVYGIRKSFPSVKNINCDKLETLRSEKKEDLVVLDTRPIEEYQVSHIPHAVQVDPETEHDLRSLGINPGTTVVCYCSIGYRSSQVAQNLFSKHKRSSETSDYQPLEVFNLEGGLFQWASEGRRLDNSDGDQVATVHPYSSFWGKLLPHHLRHKI